MGWWDNICAPSAMAQVRDVGREQLLITCSVLLYTLRLASSPIFLGLGAYEREVFLRIVHMSPEMGGHVKPPLALISRSLCFDCDSGFQ